MGQPVQNFAQDFIQKKAVSPVIAQLISRMANDIAAELNLATGATASNGPATVTKEAKEAAEIAADKFLNHISQIYTQSKVAARAGTSPAPREAADVPKFLMYTKPVVAASLVPKDNPAANTAAEQEQVTQPSYRVTPSMAG